jgi:hypothetical protein
MSEKQRKVAGVVGGRSNTKEYRADLDHYRTPKCATLALLKEVKFRGAVHEPACGPGGFIIKVLRQSGLTVTGSDLQKVPPSIGKSKVDFLEPSNQKFDNIITNPPYSLSSQFLLRARDCVRGKLAMLMRLGWLEGPGRHELLTQLPPSLVLVLSRRLPYQTAEGEWKTGDASFSHAWFVWDFSKHQTRMTELRLHLNDNKEIFP